MALIDNPKELADLSTLGSNIETRDLIYLNGALYAINTRGQEIFTVIADKGDKQIQTKIPDSAGEIRNLAAFVDDKIIVAESANGKIYEFNLKTSQLEEKKNSQEIAYPSADSIATYLTALYFLNSGDGKMVKYSPSGAGFDKGRDVFKTGAVNLKDVNSFAIDGSIYLLHQSGGIDKTLKGEIDKNFSLKNIPEPNQSLIDPSQVLTSADLTYLYVLENKNHRVLEFNKNGDYLRQFVFKENLGEIKNISINEKARKLYLLANNKIFEIDL